MTSSRDSINTIHGKVAGTFNHLENVFDLYVMYGEY